MSTAFEAAVANLKHLLQVEEVHKAERAMLIAMADAFKLVLAKNEAIGPRDEALVLASGNFNEKMDQLQKTLVKGTEELSAARQRSVI
jgi:hypothetical protein